MQMLESESYKTSKSAANSKQNAAKEEEAWALFFNAEKKILQFWSNRFSQLEREKDTLILLSRHMVEFLNIMFGSHAWLTLERLKALRQLFKRRATDIENTDYHSYRPKVQKTNWLQLTKNNENLLVVDSNMWENQYQTARAAAVASGDSRVIREESADQENGIDSIFSPMLLSPKLKSLNVEQIERNLEEELE